MGIMSIYTCGYKDHISNMIASFLNQIYQFRNATKVMKDRHRLIFITIMKGTGHGNNFFLPCPQRQEKPPIYRTG